MKNSRNIKIAILAGFAGMTILGFQNCAPTQFKEASDTVGMSLSVGGEETAMIAEVEMIPEFELIPEVPQEIQTMEKQPEVAVIETENQMPAPIEESMIAAPNEEVRESGDDGVVASSNEEVAPQTVESEVAKGPEMSDAPMSSPQEPSQPEVPQVAIEETPKEPVQTVAEVEVEVEVPAVAEVPVVAEVPPVSEVPVVAEVGEPAQEENLVECDMGRANSKVILTSFLKASPSNSSATRVCMSENACLKIINEFAAKRDCSLSNSAAGDSDKQCTEIFPGSQGTCKNAAKISDAQVSEILKGME